MMDYNLGSIQYSSIVNINIFFFHKLNLLSVYPK